MNSLGRTACCIQNFIYGQLPILWEREMVFKLQEREILAPIFSESKSSQVVDQLNHGFSLASVLGIL